VKNKSTLWVNDLPEASATVPAEFGLEVRRREGLQSPLSAEPSFLVADWHAQRGEILRRPKKNIDRCLETLSWIFSVSGASGGAGVKRNASRLAEPVPRGYPGKKLDQRAEINGRDVFPSRRSHGTTALRDRELRETADKKGGRVHTSWAPYSRTHGTGKD